VLGIHEAPADRPNAPGDERAGLGRLAHQARRCRLGGIYFMDDHRVGRQPRIVADSLSGFYGVEVIG
jgi:hypothetical protein